MDVVRTQVEKLKGHIDLESRMGQGTLVRLSVPLTTSILDGMLVSISGETFILPMECIQELADLVPSSLVSVFSGGGSGVVWHHRGRVHPVIDLRQRFGQAPEKIGAGRAAPARVALVDSGGRQVALVVDSLLGQSQVVLKPLDSSVRSCKGLSGAAILGDGKVALVIDPSGMAAGMSGAA
jgi:two-component system chemotaxis sensor kinase CheA